MSVPGVYTDGVPYNYDTYLGPYLFEPYALDMMNRLKGKHLQSVLELACGTGRLTRHLVRQLAPGDKLVATDIDRNMLGYAMASISADNLEWLMADAAELPFKDGQFELVICQFGVMFFKDKVKAFKEIHRVLKSGGTFVFNVWDALDYNPRSALIKKILDDILKEQAPDFAMKGPYSYYNQPLIVAAFLEAGLKITSIQTVPKTSFFVSNDELVKGFVDGSPLSSYLSRKPPELRTKVVNRVLEEFKAQFDQLGLAIPMQALVITAVK